MSRGPSTMFRVCCAVDPLQIEAGGADLIVLPEGVVLTDVLEAQRRLPAALVAAAVTDRGRSRGVLSQAGEARIDYFKLGYDGRTRGSQESPRQLPITVIGDLCLGLLVCMDVARDDFRRAVVGAMRAARSSLKVLCIPADMTGAWFQGETLPFPQEYDGVHVVLCNHTRTYPQYRCQSFITDMHGRKIVVQHQAEPIYAVLV